MMYVVQKAFTGNGVDFVPNQLIDGDQFPKVKQLMNQHYLRPATGDEIASARYEDDDADEPAPLPRKKLRARIRRRKK